MVTCNRKFASTVGLHCSNLLHFQILERKVQISHREQPPLAKQLNEREMSSALKLASNKSKKLKTKKIISRKHCHFNLNIHLIIKSYQHKEYLESLITESIYQHTANSSTNVGIHHGAVPSSFKSISLVQKCLGFNALTQTPRNSCQSTCTQGSL